MLTSIARFVNRQPNTTVVDSTLKEGGVCSDETLQQLGEFVAT
jgi:hypothetical protein